jgi:hypothetical protein
VNDDERTTSDINNINKIEKFSSKDARSLISTREYRQMKIGNIGYKKNVINYHFQYQVVIHLWYDTNQEKLFLQRALRKFHTFIHRDRFRD